MPGVGVVLKKKVLRHLLVRGGSTAREIEEAVGRTRQAVLAALSELSRAGVVSVEVDGNSRVYTVSDQARATLMLAYMDEAEFAFDAACLLTGGLSAALLSAVHPLAPLAAAPVLLLLVLKHL